MLGCVSEARIHPGAMLGCVYITEAFIPGTVRKSKFQAARLQSGLLNGVPCVEGTVETVLRCV